MNNGNSEPTLVDIAAQLLELKQGQAEIKVQLSEHQKRFDGVDKQLEEIKKRLDTLEDVLKVGAVVRKLTRLMLKFVDTSTS